MTRKRTIVTEDVIAVYRTKEFLYCPRCAIEFSAHAGDYFNTPDNHQFKCNACGKPMVLAERITATKLIKDKVFRRDLQDLTGG